MWTTTERLGAEALARRGDHRRHLDEVRPRADDVDDPHRAVYRRTRSRKRDLVADGTLERLADVDVEVPARVLDQLARAAPRAAALRAGSGGVTTSSLMTWTSSGTVTRFAFA